MIFANAFSFVAFIRFSRSFFLSLSIYERIHENDMNKLNAP